MVLPIQETSPSLKTLLEIFSPEYKDLLNKTEKLKSQISDHGRFDPMKIPENNLYTLIEDLDQSRKELEDRVKKLQPCHQIYYEETLRWSAEHLTRLRFAARHAK